MSEETKDIQTTNRAAETAVATKTHNKYMLKLAQQYGVDPQELWNTLAQTAFRDKDGPPSKAEMVALLIVANRYHLDPFTKEIYAFRDKKRGGIVPIVGVDGYLRRMNEHPKFDGYEITRSANIVKNYSDVCRPCPEWMEIKIFMTGRTYPSSHREYLEECYRPTDPWKNMTKRMLEWKTINQGVRVTIGFAGVHDEDEAEDIISGGELETISSGQLEVIPAETDEELFDKMLAQLAPEGFFSDEDRKGIRKFVEMTAENNNEPVPQVIKRAMANPDGFTEAMAKWESKANQGGSVEAEQDKDDTTPFDEQPPVAEPEEEADPVSFGQHIQECLAAEGLLNNPGDEKKLMDSLKVKTDWSELYGKMTARQIVAACERFTKGKVA